MLRKFNPGAARSPLDPGSRYSGTDGRASPAADRAVGETGLDNAALGGHALGISKGSFTYE